MRLWTFYDLIEEIAVFRALSNPDFFCFSLCHALKTRPDFLTRKYVQYGGGRSLVLVAWWYAPYVGLFTVTLRPWCSSLCSSNYPT